MLVEIRQTNTETRTQKERRRDVRGRTPGDRLRGRAMSLFALLCPLLLLSLARVVLGYAPRSVGNPIGSATTPPSRYESRLVNTPNPVDNSSNLLITGNLRGAKQFRAPIPYKSPTSFEGTLGSTSLDSFMRLSAVPEELAESSRGDNAFYSPTGTVATIRPGQSSVFAPTSPRVAGRIAPLRAEYSADVVDLAELPQPPAARGESRSALEGNRSTWQRLRYW